MMDLLVGCLGPITTMALVVYGSRTLAEIRGFGGLSHPQFNPARSREGVGRSWGRTPAPSRPSHLHVVS